MIDEMPIGRFLEALASSTPAPGGGGAAGLMGALGAALVSMVANLTAGKEKFRDVEERLVGARAEAEALRVRMAALADRDTEAFGAVSRAYKLPRATPDEKAARSQAIQQALYTASAVPLDMMDAARQTLELCHLAARLGNPQVVSDAGVGALAVDAALQSAALNVDINLNALKDADFVEAARLRRDRAADGHAELLCEILRCVRERMA